MLPFPDGLHIGRKQNASMKLRAVLQTGALAQDKGLQYDRWP